jgi:hypothetical protein
MVVSLSIILGNDHSLAGYKHRTWDYSPVKRYTLYHSQFSSVDRGYAVNSGRPLIESLWKEFFMEDSINERLHDKTLPCHGPYSQVKRIKPKNRVKDGITSLPLPSFAFG